MRGTIARPMLAWSLALTLLTACGQPSVADRVDRLSEHPQRYRHHTRPSPERKAVLAARGTMAELPGVVTVADRLREDEDGRAILDAGPSAVPALIPLLDDPDRRVLAAVLLAEIGGPEAATALLKQWRSLRTKRVKKHVYLRLEDPSAPNPRMLAGGYRYEGIGADFYGELLIGLSYCGLPVSSEIAADTRRAMDESERLHAAGEELDYEQEIEPTEENPHGSQEAWQVGSVVTGDEGLEILAMLGAPEGVSLYVRALGSPVRSFQYTAVQSASFLGDAVESVITPLAKLLDDPDLRGLAAGELVIILGDTLGETRPSPSASDEELDAVIPRMKERLRQLGYLPR